MKIANTVARAASQKIMLNKQQQQHKIKMAEMHMVRKSKLQMTWPKLQLTKMVSQSSSPEELSNSYEDCAEPSFAGGETL